MITGPQGSGKTTQAEILAKKLNLPFVGAGELLREYVEEGGKKSEEVREDLEEGHLVDDKVVASLVKDEISKEVYKEGFVADGYPRALHQLEVFSPDYDKVIYLKLSDEEAQKRLLSRGREDDTPEAIKERLSWHHEETRPLLDHYREKDCLITVNGEKSIEEVANEIEDKLRAEV